MTLVYVQAMGNFSPRQQFYRAVFGSVRRRCGSSTFAKIRPRSPDKLLGWLHNSASESLHNKGKSGAGGPGRQCSWQYNRKSTLPDTQSILGLWACSQGIPKMNGNKGNEMASRHSSSLWPNGEDWQRNSLLSNCSRFYAGTVSQINRKSLSRGLQIYLVLGGESQINKAAEGSQISYSRD